MQSKYGKPMKDILRIKSSFFEQNDRHLIKNNKAGEIYKQQPRRILCKLCNTQLPSERYFVSHHIEYFLCSCCGQLNGGYEDSSRFADVIYGEEYGENYKSGNQEEYNARTNVIYLPKAKYLEETLKKIENSGGGELTYLDVGAGSGYMVGAYRKLGLLARGIEISPSQVEYGNKMLSENLLKAVAPEDMAGTVRNADSEVLSFIGVLEHMINLQDILKAVQENKKIKYVFFSVPMFSLSCVIEAVFPEVFNRHLAGGHTHLFSKKSLDWMYASYSFEPLAVWDFGTDIMDLYRSTAVMLQKGKASQGFINQISQLFEQNGDALQLIIDKSGFASETHVVARVNH